MPPILYRFRAGVHNGNVAEIKVETFTETTTHPAVRGFLHRAPQANDALVLTHGAGGNANATLLLGLADAFARQGTSVLRCDLPFRQKRPHGPPSPAAASEDQQGLRRAIELMRAHFGGRVFVGGQSYGGRMASMLVAAEPKVADALLLLSYPLHPPGRPAQLRTAHLPQIQIPTLLVSGTKDPFGALAELESARALIPARTAMLPAEGAGHSLLTKRNEAQLIATILASWQRLLAASGIK
jgi:predicted alpha/beta-hydrolase family hydrolase